MVRGVLFVVGLGLLPVCWAEGVVLVRVVASTRSEFAFWVPFVVGGGCFGVVYRLLPKPMWVYVFGHELTHAIWSVLFGGRVKRMKVGSEGGHVVVTRSNVLVVLAPYFFPFYSVVVAAVFLGGDWIWGLGRMRLGFYWLLGFTYAFHWVMSWHVLRTRQPDWEVYGGFFSLVMVLMISLLIFLVALIWLLPGLRVGEVFGLLGQEIVFSFEWVLAQAHGLWRLKK